MAATTEVERWNKEGPGDLPKGMRKEFLSFIKVRDEYLSGTWHLPSTLCS